MQEKITKAEKIKQHLFKYGSITSMDAFNLYSVTRLADNVFQLRRKGWDIISADETYTNRDGITSHFSRYVLIADPEGNAFQRKADQLITTYHARPSETKLVSRPVKYKKGVDTAADHAQKIIKLGNEELKKQNLF